MVESGAGMLEAGGVTLSGLSLGRLGRRSSGLLAGFGLRGRLPDRDLVLDRGLHALLLGGLRSGTHCEGMMMISMLGIHLV